MAAEPYTMSALKEMLAPKMEVLKQMVCVVCEYIRGLVDKVLPYFGYTHNYLTNLSPGTTFILGLIVAAYIGVQMWHKFVLNVPTIHIQISHTPKPKKPAIEEIYVDHEEEEGEEDELD